MSNIKYPPSQAPCETRIDLGEDLLQQPDCPSDDHPSLDQTVDLSSEKILDMLQTARILQGEGLIEDSKKQLRHILIQDPGNHVAIRMLAEIHDKEILKLLNEEEESRTFKKMLISDSFSQEDSEMIMKQLDSDLKLNLFTESQLPLVTKQNIKDQDSRNLNDYFKLLEDNLVHASFQDWIDIGVGFLEMELYSVSTKVFANVCRQMDLLADLNIELKLSATSLLAQSLILEGKLFEAIEKIQPLLRDGELPKNKKTELFYLMGKIYEFQKKFELSHSYYYQTKEIDPHYRDLDYRLTKKPKK